MNQIDTYKKLKEYLEGVGKAIFLNTKTRTLFKFKSAYGDSWDEKQAEKDYERIKTEILKDDDGSANES